MSAHLDLSRIEAALADGLDPDRALAILDELDAIRAQLDACAQRVRVSLRNAIPTTNRDGDRLLTAAEAAKRLGKSESWLRHRRGRFPFEVVIDGSVGYSAHGLDEYLRDLCAGSRKQTPGGHRAQVKRRETAAVRPL